ncbi:CGNR zinc finger domain-containing protein [Kribbella sancticallisti]|uniref:CGNR zinc finger domain-containing protein n=1 Tax=Kribbella sancticallisti TaxID=460087 RepID=A0ABN2EWT8_9ACTN
MDPRPLTGEPVSMDLLNTVWVEGEQWFDLLETVDGLQTWLAGQPAVSSPLAVSATEAARRQLVESREVLRAVVKARLDGRVHDEAQAQLNDLLSRGRLVRRLGAGGPELAPEVDDPADLIAWLAADDYLRLLERDPTRIRACAHPDCVLHFYDVSRKANRRWCSMAGCGNRAKAARHYARSKESD